ncbi:putative DNA-binding domain-containing protein [Nitrosomonas sp.]|uniref:HvfC family RiPP maturation protein n=1 Tax=Nitrosomonas sp. TaxID=42353 RepID=UPI002848BD63|nr:putative DNA-binding domain-containing protein [Nitrosomonas sp.]MDR4513310.1 putative DNA-binding domain-containing protein [Nitrosomonas sp.]
MPGMSVPDTPEQPDFVRQQYAFAAYIREPDQRPCPHDIEERRMKIYCDLFYNNIEGFMANTYPVLRSIMPDERWHDMIRDYFATHRSRTPLFPEMPREFLRYLQYERGINSEDPPFMLELAHYEWVELALSILDEKIDPDKFNSEGDVLSGIPVISPLAWLLSYRFPVHKLSSKFQPQLPGEKTTNLIVYRDALDKIHFIESNPVTARLMQLMIDNECDNGRMLLTKVAVELQHPQPDIVIQGGYEIMQDFLNRGILLGARY